MTTAVKAKLRPEEPLRLLIIEWCATAGHLWAELDEIRICARCRVEGTDA